MSEFPSSDGEPGFDCRQSDADQWKSLFEEIRPGLARFLSGKLSQGADVDDCLQSVFVSMLENRRPIPPAARRAWLFRVAANEAALWWRKKSTTDRVLEKHAEYNVASETESDPVETRDSVQQINEVIEQLPETTREIIRLRIHENETFQAIADRLGLPLGTVLTRMRRALERIRGDVDPKDS